ncbi:uncharacterized protein KD926_003921 [Aspergillus affinis]|uniref:uncharacterized protein n=1 Tax=Aspergillus affinis TaxID=1070780 RepID=UPI0022FEE5C4|nr:uncharacterized protein KD926_003921 [Aspergillus affinis]KAI9046083.1 hypothetical protein KD926_003921 [Aspergillus affinis]
MEIAGDYIDPATSLALAAGLFTGWEEIFFVVAILFPFPESILAYVQNLRDNQNQHILELEATNVIRQGDPACAAQIEHVRLEYERQQILCRRTQIEHDPAARQVLETLTQYIAMRYGTQLITVEERFQLALEVCDSGREGLVQGGLECWIPNAIEVSLELQNELDGFLQDTSWVNQLVEYTVHTGYCLLWAEEARQAQGVIEEPQPSCASSTGEVVSYSREQEWEIREQAWKFVEPGHLMRLETMSMWVYNDEN